MKQQYVTYFMIIAFVFWEWHATRTLSLYLSFLSLCCSLFSLSLSFCGGGGRNIFATSPLQ
jgi:hypothetical protein